jgi:hypothetical protein
MKEKPPRTKEIEKALDRALLEQLDNGEVNLEDIISSVMEKCLSPALTEPEVDINFLKDLIFVLHDRKALESISDIKQRERIEEVIAGFRGAVDPKKFRKELKTFQSIAEAIFDRVFLRDQEIKLSIGHLTIERLTKEYPDLSPDVIRDVFGIEEEAAGIGKKYFIRLNREKILGQKLEELRGIEKSKELAELVEAYKKLDQLYKEVRNLYKDDKFIVNYLDIAMSQVRRLMAVRDKLKPKEIQDLKNEINMRIKDLERIKSTRKVIPKEAQRRLSKGAELCKTILTGVGLWGLAVGWFLPLWTITKMYEQIEKGPLVGKK